MNFVVDSLSFTFVNLIELICLIKDEYVGIKFTIGASPAVVILRQTGNENSNYKKN